MPPYIQVESYAELKTASGNLEFVTFYQEKEPYEGPASVIKGCEPVNWQGEVR